MAALGVDGAFYLRIALNVDGIDRKCLVPVRRETFRARFLCHQVFGQALAPRHYRHSCGSQPGPNPAYHIQMQWLHAKPPAHSRFGGLMEQSTTSAPISDSLQATKDRTRRSLIHSRALQPTSGHIHAVTNGPSLLQAHARRGPLPSAPRRSAMPRHLQRNHDKPGNPRFSGLADRDVLFSRWGYARGSS